MYGVLYGVEPTFGVNSVWNCGKKTRQIWPAFRRKNETAQNAGTRDCRKLHFSWLKNLLIILSIIYVTTTVFFVILFDSNIYTRSMDYIYIIPLTVLIFVIGYNVFKYPEVYVGELNNNFKTEKYKYSTLTAEKANQYLEMLQKCMEKEKPYTDSDLKLPDLAEKINF